MFFVLNLTLRELEALTGFGLTVLLPLDRTRVTGQEAVALQRGAQIRLVPGQRLADAVAQRAGLAGKTATGHGREDVILAIPLGHAERLVDDHLQHRTGEILGLILAVDDDIPPPRLSHTRAIAFFRRPVA